MLHSDGVGIIGKISARLGKLMGIQVGNNSESLAEFILRRNMVKVNVRLMIIHVGPMLIECLALACNR